MKYLTEIDDTLKGILNLAKEQQNRAYAPYSNFKVGAAVLTQSGKVYLGCNIENASYSLTICAERVALFKAISEGHKDIKAIFVIGPQNEPISPCGACRQVILELAKDATIYLSNFDMTKIIETNAKELLPYGFNL
ncbi:cytidine deaminase [Caldicellulosiruptor naganoensis]|uniref:Cytidine deaminase n=1 Tax=Caldicellulosiruptor naganoensis TaxID=29324 RepID=A0ABY7BIR7_9FIRM|nr:cytidine deaminase [Caldicellulosiruptor naganoensis]WAM32390.1 cytidine deaminase [Caldicellulosiruptor naganoensis]